MHIVYTAKPSRKHITSHNNEQNAVPVLLCLECSNHLVTIDNAAEASLCQHSWPGYIWSFLTNIDMHRHKIIAGCSVTVDKLTADMDVC